MDELWSSLDYTIHESRHESTDSNATAAATTVKKEWYDLQIYLNCTRYIICYIARDNCNCEEKS